MNDRIGAGVSDETDALGRVGDRPDRQIVVGAHHTARREELGRTGADAFGEVANRFAADQPVPAGIDRPVTHLAVRLRGLLGRCAVPSRVADLLQPGLDALGAVGRVRTTVPPSGGRGRSGDTNTSSKGSRCTASAIRSA